MTIQLHRAGIRMDTRNMQYLGAKIVTDSRKEVLIQVESRVDLRRYRGSLSRSVKSLTVNVLSSTSGPND